MRYQTAIPGMLVSCISNASPVALEGRIVEVVKRDNGDVLIAVVVDGDHRPTTLYLHPSRVTPINTSHTHFMLGDG